MAGTITERVIGIDLGTTNACVGVVEGGVPMLIPNAQGQTQLPCSVGVGDHGRRLIGQMARRQAVIYAEHTATGLKRLLGRKFSSQAVRQAMDLVSYRLIPQGNDDLQVALRGDNIPIADLCVALFEELKRIAEQYLNEPVRKVILTAPMWFGEPQRQALREVAQRVGLDVLRILHEPVSAGLAYGIGQGKSKARRIGVYSLGGGTFEFTLLSVNGSSLETQSFASDLFLGGEEFERRLLDWLIFGFAKEHKIDLRQDRTALQRLRDAVEKARADLSSVEDVNIEVPFIISSATNEPLHLVRSVSRAKLEELTEDLIERTLQICRGVLAEAGVDPQELDTILLVGGSTRMPKIQAALQEWTGRPPSVSIPPDEVIALGAALQGAALVHVSESAPTLPPVGEKPRSSRALGLAVAGGQCFHFIEAGVSPPIERRFLFTTQRDAQTTIRLIVTEGNSERAEENQVLREILIENLRSAPRGEVDVEVLFQLSPDGNLTVTSRNLETKEERATVLPTQTLLDPSRKSPNTVGFTLELRQDEELQRTQTNIERLISEITKLIPKAELAVGASDMGLDAVRRSRAAIERAKIVIIRGEPLSLLDTQNLLRRTAAMLKGVTGTAR